MSETTQAAATCAKSVFRGFRDQRCGHKPMAGSKYCRFHDPAVVKARQDKQLQKWAAKHAVDDATRAEGQRIWDALGMDGAARVSYAGSGLLRELRLTFEQAEALIRRASQ